MNSTSSGGTNTSGQSDLYVPAMIAVATMLGKLVMKVYQTLSKTSWSCFGKELCSASIRQQSENVPPQVMVDVMDAAAANYVLAGRAAYATAVGSAVQATRRTGVSTPNPDDIYNAVAAAHRQQVGDDPLSSSSTLSTSTGSFESTTAHRRRRNTQQRRRAAKGRLRRSQRDLDVGGLTGFADDDRDDAPVTRAARTRPKRTPQAGSGG